MAGSKKRDSRDGVEGHDNDHDSMSDISDVSEDDMRSILSNDLTLEDEDVKTSARVTTEGRINVNITQRHARLSKIILPHLPEFTNTVEVPDWLTGHEEPPPPLNVVIQIVGSRGDVQPFVALGKVLKEKYGHRVRLATHATFKKFVTENGLEFFNIGGDPANLMDYMVKNPGLLPGKQSLKDGDVGKRKKEIKEIMSGCWRACVEAGDGMDEDDEEYDENDPKWRPFVASAIIANPPGFAHVHCAEKLAIPIHLMFTMPWSPTQAFPHPLANVHSTDTDARVANFLSYPLVMMLTWQGLGATINDFRQKVLGLDPVSVMWTPILASMSKIPFTYCWSPALIPKPSDWASNIVVAGFYFLSLASSYKPDPALAAFLEAGPPPVYIGFGSIVVEDPNAMTKMILEGVKKAGVRALVSKGWGGFGADSIDVPDSVFFLGNCPHDWLFKRVSAVVHHGGAGTTAAGIAAGVPTLVVPFFGDQPFWGSMVYRAGAGPAPIPHKQLTADKLAEALKFCLQEKTQAAAKRMGEQIREENGPELGSQHFHAMLKVDRIRCALDHYSTAVWRIRHTETRISALAAAVLCNEGILKVEDLKLNRIQEYDLSDQPFDPISGALTSVLGTLSNLMVGTLSLPMDMIKAAKDANANTDANQRGQKSSISAGISRQSTDLATMQNSELYSSKTGPASEPSSMRKSLTMMSRSSGSFSSSEKKKKGHEHHYGTAIKDAADVVRKDWFTLVNLPRELTQGVAKGFHNAPRLYGDDTVRTPDKVTGLRTGLKAGGKQFGWGMYDAVTGLVTQPYHGAKKEGYKGFFKGAGKGIGGLLLKPEAAVLGGIGYAWEGFYRHARHHHQTEWEARHGLIPIEDSLRASRLAEGYLDFHSATQERKDAIVRRWNELQKLKEERERVAKEKAAANHCPVDWLDKHRNSRTASIKADSIRPGGRHLSSSGSVTGSVSEAASIKSNEAKTEEGVKPSSASTLEQTHTLTPETYKSGQAEGLLTPAPEKEKETETADKPKEEEDKPAIPPKSDRRTIRNNSSSESSDAGVVSPKHGSPRLIPNEAELMPEMEKIVTSVRTEPVHAKSGTKRAD